MALDVNKMTKDQLRQHVLMLAMELTQLELENKNLKEELEQAIYWKVDYKKSYKQADAKKEELLEENKNLKEKVKVLEESLDRKEEVNKKLRSDLLMYQNQYWCLTD